LLLFVLMIASIAFYAFKAEPGGSIIGHVTPPDGASTAMAISQKDTVKAEISPKGIFQLAGLNSSTYTLVIQAKAPYKNLVKQNIIVTDVTTDVGEIILEK